MTARSIAGLVLQAIGSGPQPRGQTSWVRSSRRPRTEATEYQRTFQALPLAATHRTNGRRFRNDLVLVVHHGTLHKADCPAALHDRPFGPESNLPDRTKEIDFEFDRGERSLERESACKGHSLRGVSNVAENSAVERSRGICMLRSS